MTFAFLVATYILSLFYFVSLLVFTIGLFRIREESGKKEENETEEDFPFVSVIVAARDEEPCIPACLDALIGQTYPQDRYEIVWVDDQSTDQGFECVRRYVAKTANLRLFSTATKTEFYGTPKLTQDEKVCDISTGQTLEHGKQVALDLGICGSRGEFILTTDADCIVPPTWLTDVVGKFQPDVGMVAGFSTLTVANLAEDEKKKLWQRLFFYVQTIELLAVFSLCAGILKTGLAFACTGRNLAWRKKVYEEIGGFKTIGHTAIEDNMLMQTVQLRTNWQVVPLCSPTSVVETRPEESIGAFLKQRARWGSNSFEHRPSMLLFMSLIYLFYVSLMLLTTLTLLGIYNWRLMAIVWGLKILPETVIVVRGCRLFQRQDLLKFFPFVQPLQPLQVAYVLICPILGMFGKIGWKGREMKRNKKS